MVSRPGDSVISRPGNSVVSRPGNSVISGPGNSVVSRPGNSVISRPGNSVVSRPGNSIVNRPGDSVVSRPGNSVVSVKARRAAPPKPPACATISTVAANLSIVITVWSAEHHPVGSPTCIQCIIQCISGVTAVAGHRQTILTNLITDGERRVFSVVPQTVSTLDLHIIV